MKSKPPEAPTSGDLPASLSGASENRGRRTLAEAASQLARSVVGGTRGGSPRGKSERDASASSAAASVHRLRKVLERDRATVAAQEPEAPEDSLIIRTDRDELPTARAPERAREPARPCTTCGEHELPLPAHMQRSRTLPRRAGAIDFVLEDRDDDAWLSVHDEPTRLTPARARTERVDGRASALAAAAASAFGVDVSQ